MYMWQGHIDDLTCIITDLITKLGTSQLHSDSAACFCLRYCNKQTVTQSGHAGFGLPRAA